MQFTAEQYIKDVHKKSILTCNYVQLAIKRHLNDLKKAETDPDYPYYFSEKHAKHNIQFTSFCPHIKGKLAGQPIILESWQQAIRWIVFGWRRKDNDKRRFTTAYIEVARKNGKSTDAAPVSLYCLMGEGEAGAEVFNAAVDEGQARIVWNVAKEMVNRSSLKNHIKTWRNSITMDSTASFLKPLSRKSDNKDGLNISACIIDEVHAWTDSNAEEIMHLIKSGTSGREVGVPLLWMITTAGKVQQGVGKQEHDFSVQVLEGQKEADDYFAIIYSLDPEDLENENAWLNEDLWIKSNPNLGVSVDIELMRSQARDAKGNPSKINEFLTKRLNIWTQSYTRWILPDKWKLNANPVNEDSLIGRKCTCAIDLSTTIDISGYCLCFPPEGNEEYYQMLWRFFIPGDNIHERSLKENVPYYDWIKKGLVIATPGDVIDYKEIENYILKDADKFEILEIPFDPYNATHLVNNLTDQGLNCVKFGQAIASISPAVKNFERMVLKGKLATNDNPVMNYMISCAEIYSDANNNQKVIKPDRRKSSKRIDGVIMAIMALHRAMHNLESVRSVYEDRGLRVLK